MGRRLDAPLWPDTNFSVFRDIYVIPLWMEPYIFSLGEQSVCRVVGHATSICFSQRTQRIGSAHRSGILMCGWARCKPRAASRQKGRRDWHMDAVVGTAYVLHRRSGWQTDSHSMRIPEPVVSECLQQDERKEMV